MARVKSDKKRDDILLAAKTLFLESGFSEVSMDSISREASVSKNTLYNHFKNKNQLFSEVLKQHWQSGKLPKLSSSAKQPIRTELKTFCIEFIEYLYKPDTTALFRILIAESGRFPDLAQSILKGKTPPVKTALMEYLDQQIKLSKLKACNVETAANQLFGMLKEDAFWHVLLGFRKKYNKKEIDELVEEALNTFLICYLKQTR